MERERQSIGETLKQLRRARRLTQKMLAADICAQSVISRAENNEEWFDMVRYNCLDGIDFVSYGYLRSFAHKNLPIPYDALAGNAKLIQNPSYIFSNKD